MSHTPITDINFGYQTWPDRFMPYIVQRLLAKVPGTTNDRVFNSGYDDRWHLDWPVADQFITLYIPNFPVDQRDVTGGGYYNTAFDARLEVTGFVRLESDQEGVTTLKMEESVFGVYTFAQQILAALQMWKGDYQLDDSGDPTLRFLRRPMRIDPGFTINKMTGRGDTRWSVIKMTFQCSFVSNIGHPYPVQDPTP